MKLFQDGNPTWSVAQDVDCYQSVLGASSPGTPETRGFTINRNYNKMGAENRTKKQNKVLQGKNNNKTRMVQVNKTVQEIMAGKSKSRKLTKQE